MESSDLTDAQWERLRLLLPPQKPRTSRPHRPPCEGPPRRPQRHPLDLAYREPVALVVNGQHRFCNTL
jgi:transposase